MSATLSPTQIALYLRNPDEWRAVYLNLSRRSRPVIGDFIGADVHRLLAAYLRGEAHISPPGPPSSKWGRTWYPHKIASAGLQHLPEPGAVAVEVRRVFELADARVVCIKDAEGDGLVIDHKTGRLSSALDDLASDVQATLYAVEHIYRTGAEAVTLRWIWYALDGSGSREVEQVVSLEDLAPTTRCIEHAIRRMGAERWESLTSSTDSTRSGAPIQTSLPLI